MRFEGRIIQWNDERGFGFIEPAAGGDRLFVHISAFGPGDRHANVRPKLGERVSFEVEIDAKGRKQARRISRPDGPAALHSSTLSPRQGRDKRSDERRDGGRHRHRRAASGGMGRLLTSTLGWVVVAVIGWQAYQWWAAYGSPSARTKMDMPQHMIADDSSAPAAAMSAASASYRCDGRRYCSQMTSCAEATYFLRNCPGVEMDGNRDGVPCEQQWCTSPFAK